MNIIPTSVNGLPTLGAFAIATDKFVILSELWTEKAKKAIEKALNVPIIQMNIGDTSLVGILSAGNSKGLVVPHIISEAVLSKLEEQLGNGINIKVVPSKITCLGNCILVNDNKAIVHEKFEPEAIQVLEETLEVPIEKGNILNSPLVGSHAIVTNNGLLAHPLTTEMELNWLSESFDVPSNLGTINRGIPYVSIGCFANSYGAIAGKETTGPELQRLYQTLKGS
ncbi:MAG: translation initiation factor IF-6 [Candidatus Heimdallarchaeota archaeon]|nr:translation initiation factor IF-6 [Candidatus Heimdallarchaeota archaeon]